MASYDLPSAHLFTPGRASYVTSGPEPGSFEFHLTAASAQRADTAAEMFDEHVVAIYAGGYPGIAQKWPIEHIPPIGKREADLMALPLEFRLLAAGWSQEDIAKRVKRQGDSNNSIGDVIISIERGLLDPNDFNNEDGHGIDLVSGTLHGIRFRKILAKGLDMDPKRIRRAPIHDPYGTPATEFRPKEPASIALAKEYAAIVATSFVLRDVRPGNLEDLRYAEQRMNAIAA